MDKYIEKISFTLLKTMAVFSDEIYEELVHIDSEDFLVHNFLNYPQSYVSNRLLISYNSILLDLSLQTWTNILKRISDSSLALYTCISFGGKFLGVDFLRLYLDLENTNELVRADVAAYFNERKALLWPNKWDVKQLDSMHESTAPFKLIHDKLIAEGARSIDVDFLWSLSGN